jgi:GNAT superfamily N-acetyltransferase
MRGSHAEDHAVIVRPARREEAGRLGELALRAKAHWGYDQDFLDRCRPLLTVTDADLVTKRLLVADDGGPRGFAGLAGPPPTGELTDLWVEPAAMGRGVGRLLFRHAVGAAREAGMTALLIEAEPHAVGFYRAMGAQPAGETESGLVPGRMLPVLRYHVQPDHVQPDDQPTDVGER